MNLPFSDIQRVLAIKFRHIGDVLLTIPALKALKATFPKADLTLMINSGTEEMVSGNPVLDHIIVFNRDTLTASIAARVKEELRVISEVRKGRFDMTVNFTDGDRGALVSFLSGARYRLAYDPRGRGMMGKRKLYTHIAIKPDWRIHTIDRDLSLISAFGINGGDRKVDLYYPEAAAEKVRHLLESSGMGEREHFVHIHPTSRWMFKAWTIEGNAAVVDHIQNMGVPVILTSGPAQREIDMVTEIVNHCSTSPIVFSGSLTLKELAAIIDRAIMFFGVDSAPMHMAAALGTPVVSMFGPSANSIWEPRGEDDTVITSQHECRPCMEDGCNGSKISKCLTEIHPGEVIKIIEDKLA